MTRQRENLLVLMDNLDQVDSLQQKVAQSAGSAQKKFDDAYGNSTEAKVNNMKNSLQKMWIDVISSDSINQGVSALNNIISTIDAIVSKVGVLGMVFGALIPIIAVKFTLALRTATLALIEQKGAQVALTGSGLAEAVGKVITQMLGLTTATEGATTAAIGLNVATGGILLAIGALVVGVGYLINSSKQAEQSQEELQKQMSTLASTMKDSEKTVENLNGLLKEQSDILAKGDTNQTASDKKRLHDIEVQLAQAVPEATTAYDEQNTALATNLDLTSKLVKMKQDEAVANAHKVIGSLDTDSQLYKLKEQINTLNEIKHLKESIANDKNIKFSNIGTDVLYDQEGLGKNIDNLKSIYKNSNLSKEVKDQITKAGSLKEILQALTAAQGELEGAVVKGKQSLNDYNSAAEYLNDTLKENNKVVKDEALGKNNSTDANKNNTKSTKDNTNAVDDNTSANDDNKNSNDNKAKSLSDLFGVTQDASSATDDLSKKTQSLNSDIKDLNQIIYDESQNQGLSADQVADLIIKYPELANAIISTSDGYKIEQTALQNLRQEKINEMSATLQAQLSDTRNTLTGAQDRLKAYGVEISAITSLAQAKLAANSIPVADIRSMPYGSSMPNDSYMQSLNNSKAQNDALRSQVLQYGQLQDQIRALQGLLTSSSYGVSNYYSNAQKAAKSDAKTAEQAAQDRVQAEKNANDKLVALRDQYVKAVKAKLEEEKQAELDNAKAVYDAQMKVIDAKEKALDRENDNQSYQEQLAKENEKKQDLLKQKAQLSLNPEENQAAIDALNKQIADEQQTIDDLMREHNTTLQKNSLDDQKDKIDSDYQKTQDAIELKYKQLEDDTKLYTEANQKILQNSMDEILSMIEKYAPDFSQAGENIASGMVNAVKAGIDAMQALRTGNYSDFYDSGKYGSKYNGSSSSSSSSSSGSSSTTYSVGSRGQKVKEIQEALHINDDGIFGNLTKQAVMNFQKSHGLTADGIVGAQTMKALGLSFDTGGMIVGDGLIFAHNKERMLTKEQTSVFDDFVYNKLPIMTNLLSNIKPNIQIPNLSNLIPATSTGVPMDFTFDIKVNGGSAKDFEKSTKEIAKQVFTEVNNMMTRNGQRHR